MKTKRSSISILLWSILISSLSTLTWSAQSCNTSILTTAPNARFLMHFHLETVTDQKTGLMWTFCPMGWDGIDCSHWTGGGSVSNWSDAIAYANNSTHGGYGDWRVPNIKELSSIVERSCKNPSINQSVFQKAITSSNHWSSSPYDNLNTKAWAIDFSDGTTSSDLRTASNRLFLVRN